MIIGWLYLNAYFCKIVTKLINVTSNTKTIKTKKKNTHASKPIKTDDISWQKDNNNRCINIIICTFVFFYIFQLPTQWEIMFEIKEHQRQFNITLLHCGNSNASIELFCLWQNKYFELDECVSLYHSNAYYSKPQQLPAYQREIHWTLCGLSNFEQTKLRCTWLCVQGTRILHFLPLAMFVCSFLFLSNSYVNNILRKNLKFYFNLIIHWFFFYKMTMHFCHIY